MHDDSPVGRRNLAASSTSRVARASELLVENSVSAHQQLVERRCFQLQGVEACVESTRFKVGIVILIVLNALFVGITTDLSVKNTLTAFNGRNGSDYDDMITSDAIFAVDLAFNSVFFVELMLRIVSQEGRFICGPEWTWNVFDTLVVALSIAELGLSAVGTSSSYIRVLRLARVVRSLRMVRLVRFLSLFNKLHAVSLAFVRCRTMLLTAILCLVILLFVFAIIIASAIATYIADANESDMYVDDMQVFFGSLFMTMLTLFMSVSGGVDWWTVCELLLHVGWGYASVFLIFIVITVLAVLNVINAIFVNDAVDATHHDLDLRSQADLAENRIMLKRLTSIFQQMEKDRRDMVGLEAFLRHMQNTEMKAQLSLIGLNFCDGVSLFRLLDVDATRFLTIDQFVMGCLRLKGQCILIDMNVEIKNTRNIMVGIQEMLSEFLGENRRVSKMRADVGPRDTKGDTTFTPQRNIEAHFEI